MPPKTRNTRRTEKVVKEEDVKNEEGDHLNANDNMEEDAPDEKKPAGQSKWLGQQLDPQRVMFLPGEYLWWLW